MNFIKGTKFWYTKTSIERAQSLQKALSLVGFQMGQVGATSPGTSVPILFSMRLQQTLMAEDSFEQVRNSFYFDNALNKVATRTKPMLPTWAIVDTRPHLLPTEYTNIFYTNNTVMNDPRGTLRDKYIFILENDPPKGISPLIRDLMLELL